MSAALGSIDTPWLPRQLGLPRAFALAFALALEALIVVLLLPWHRTHGVADGQAPAGHYGRISQSAASAGTQAQDRHPQEDQTQTGAQAQTQANPPRDPQGGAQA